MLVSLAASLASMPFAVALGMAAGAGLAGRLSGANASFHGGLVAVLWIAAQALLEPLQPQAADVAGDLARTLLTDVLLLVVGATFGALGGRTRAAPG